LGLGGLNVTCNLPASYDFSGQADDFFRKMPGPAVTISPVMAMVDATPGNQQTTPRRVDWPTALAEHGRWLRSVVLARLGERQAVDEVLQNVALAVVERGDQLRDTTKVAPWLYRVAVIASLQYRRRQGRGRKLIDEYVSRVPLTDSDDDEPDPLDWLLAGEQRKLVRTALKRMPRRDAEILILKYTEDWNYRQLAEHLGLSISAVEARLHRARKKMRRLLVEIDPSLASATR
jgi:RNA polymerase sigma-70 factor (ECF subfamily)